MKYLVPFIIALLVLLAIIRYTDRLTDNEFVKRVPGSGDVMTGFVGCITPRGDRITSGQSVIAYANPRVFSTADCQSQVRTCQVSRFSSILSGSYQHPRCELYVPPRPTGRSCKTPRGVTIADGRQVLAYQSRISRSGVCHAEARLCDDGTLQGSYQHRDCTLAGFVPGTTSQGYTVSNPPVIHPFSGAKKYPQELIQPIKPDLSGKLFDTDGKRVDVLPNRPDQWNNTINTPVTGDRSYLDVIIPPAEPKPRRWTLYPPVYSGCITPRGEKIAPGLKIAAYSKPFGTKDSVCTFEMRQCINGKLNGSYGFSQCLQTNLFSDQLNQQISRDQSEVFYNQYCETPRRTQIRNGEQILAYKTLSTTSPQPCETEIRTCRKGFLDGSYQYSQCLSLPTSVTSSGTVRGWAPNDVTFPVLDPLPTSVGTPREPSVVERRLDALGGEIRMRADQLGGEIRLRVNQVGERVRVTADNAGGEIRMRADQLGGEIRLRVDQLGDEIRIVQDQLYGEISIRTDQIGGEIQLRTDQLADSTTRFNNWVSERRDQFWDRTRGN